MNRVKPDLLTPTEKFYLSDDIKTIFEDDQVKRRIILRRRGAQTFNPTTGIVTYTWTNTETYAMKGLYASTEMPSGKGQGVIQFGDVYFLVPEKELLETVPLDKDDRILEHIYTYKSVGVTQGNSYGAVAVTKGSKTVTGDGTEWATYLGKGDYFKLYIEPLSYLNEIASISTNTSLTLVDNYTGETKTNQAYQVYREFFIVGQEEDTFSGLLRRYICREIK